ncbi:MAG: sulfotransferase [Ginsengibacter sp.]
MQPNKKANLFIVGAMKAGTTSFCETLGEHPCIYFAPIKEPNYFVSNLPSQIFKESPYFSIDNYFAKEFPTPLHIAHLRKATHYSKLYEMAKEQKYLAEGSTAYLHAPESAELIFEYNPEAKIIILVRDGLKRAFSHYKMDVGLGKTNQSFKDAIQKDIDEYNGGTENNWSYLGMSLYHKNILRFKEYFGDNVLVLDFDELIRNQEKEFEKLFEFLAIKRIPLGLKKTNESANIRFKKILYLLKQSGIKDFLSNALPKKLRHKIFRSIQKKEAPKMILTEKMRTEIETIFTTDQAKLKLKC